MGTGINAKLDTIINKVDLLGINSTSTCKEESSKTASGEIECFNYTFTESKRIFVVTIALYNSTPYDLALTVSGTANYTACATWKIAPLLFTIYQVDGTAGQTVVMKSQAYIQAQHTVKAYLIE